MPSKKVPSEPLSKLACSIEQCMSCPLGHTRTKSVPGEGGCKSGIMLIGEAPGRIEDETGRPFVGKSGRLLDDMMNAVGLSREDVFITSVLKCRPPDNRDPTPNEKETCKPWLEKQLESLSPRVIAPLGRHGLMFLQDRYGKTFDKISKEHGRVYRFDEKWGEVCVLPLFHPAALIYRRNLMSEALEDMQTLADMVR